MSPAEEVRKASERFYAALNSTLNGDASLMADAWSHSATVTTMHPIGGRQVGWKEVRESWEQVARLATGGEVTLTDRIIDVAGDVAIELGVEDGQFSVGADELVVAVRVTNIYRREAEGWRIVHHHTDLAPVMTEALNPLQP